ncbi:dihydroxy-acid dehydratase [Anaerosporomusa subterranea]|uniref:Dihydroxy-acid dehydratase n=1 Tax=Anaerosporomusa subterranea TaxID=1794912 RepID=A0A154BLA1_ANASB|nr:dihydroxy-acid dehydratase [Anaerosporomusa subterranea]KYZ74747.1 dihydroxy-acid dehydratase [Anaerosporomusa subterranea]
MISDEVKKGSTRAAHRSLFYAMGYSPEDLTKPLIGIVNAQNEIIPGHMHLDQVAEAVKYGVYAAGGTPAEFPAIGICDGIAMGHEGMKYPLPSRELIADSIEAMAVGHKFDGLVLIPNCDKIVPGMLMAAARLNIPAIVMSGGPMMAGRYQGQDISVSTMFEAAGKFESGQISGEELHDMELSACPGCGSCAGMFTANTMNCMSEVLGMALPGNGTVPAVNFGARRMLAKQAGKRIVEMVKADVKPRDILTHKAFENAITVDMGIGGSTNTVLHLPAIAYEAGVELPLDLFNEIAQKTPYITKLSPGGTHHIQDLFEAGGMQVVMKELSAKNLIHTDIPTVTGKTVGENFAKTKNSRPDVVHSVNNPYRPTGGLAILRGNLAPDGAVVKESAVDEAMLKHTGPARVFDSEDEGIAAIVDKKINKGDVVIIRYEGPKGGPGMREMLNPTSVIVGMGLDKDVALLTDGRFSGASRGAAIGHISPESAEGGPLALVEEGDIIEIDIPARKLNVRLTDEELASRRAKWVRPAPRVTTGYLARYAKLVTSASTGAVLK